MSLTSSRTVKFASAATLALLSACSQQPNPAPAPVAYNPPPPSLAATPAGKILWYQVTFASGSSRIDAYGREAITGVADSIRNDPALKVTVVGKADSVGGGGANMRLSKQRADAVHNALLRTGKVTEQRIETRWTGERPQGLGPMVYGADTSNRVVDIAVHN